MHGGEHKAVYCYPLAHYDYWKKELPERELPMGTFGENFRIDAGKDGLLEESVHLGDQLSIGTAEVVVTQPRLPCYKLGVRFGSDDMVRRFLASGRTGFYVAVLREGEVGAGDEIEVISGRPTPLRFRRSHVYMWPRGLERPRSARCGVRCAWKNCRRAGRNTSGSGCGRRRRSDLRLVARIGLGAPYAVSACGAFDFDSCHGRPRGLAFSSAALMAVLSFGGMNAKHVTPILNVSDISASFAWFEKWGWRKCWDWGTPPTFGAVGAEECEIFLCQGSQGGRGRGANASTFGPDGDQTADKGAWMSVWVNDVDEVHRQCVAAGLDVTFPPADMPWSVREMHVRHPDGHVFRVSKGIEGVA